MPSSVNSPRLLLSVGLGYRIQIETNGPFRWILTTGLSLTGLAASVLYLVVRFQRRTAHSPLTGHRPWRPAGAVLCAAISILAYIGFGHLDHTRHQTAFILLWAGILLLLLCLGLMVVIDLRYTRRLLRRALGQNPLDLKP